LVGRHFLADARGRGKASGLLAKIELLALSNTQACCIFTSELFRLISAAKPELGRLRYFQWAARSFHRYVVNSSSESSTYMGNLLYTLIIFLKYERFQFDIG
jgi:hypothetical protein